jgi:glycosyltransferase involved in cell wall biosynthesis
MTINRLIYLANARLPTEKAHGYQICQMCKAFAQHRLEVLLLHPYRHQDDSALQGQSVFDYYGLPQKFEVRTLPNIDFLRIEHLLPGGAFTVLLFLHSLLWGLAAALAARREKADLYYTRDSEVAYWLLILGLPTVYEAHVVPKRAQRKLLQRIAQQPALRLVVVLTSYIKERFVEMGFPSENIAVLADGVDLSLFADLPNREECRRRLGLPQDRPIIGYIGRFLTMGMEKGIPELVQAMAYLPLLHGREPLLLCVGGPMDAVPVYLDFARRYGIPEQRLKWVDRVPNQEVPCWIRACDVVTIPWPWTEFSAYFTSPLKLFEYMAAGAPIVASDLPSLREVLTNEENAVLVSPGNPKLLGHEIVRLLRTPERRERLSGCALRDVERYTWKRRAGEILDRINTGSLRG